MISHGVAWNAVGGRRASMQTCRADTMVVAAPSMR
jgi:hypothetical protein